MYPNTREDYSWKDEDWWIVLTSEPSYEPEFMGGHLEWLFHSGASFQVVSDFLMEPLNRMYHQILRTRDCDKRFQIYKRANEFIAD